MKKHRIWSLILLFLVLALGLWGVKRYQDRFVYVGEVRYEKSLEALDLSGKPLPVLEELTQLPQLKQLDLRGTGLTGPEYDRLTELLPGCRILWEIPFQGNFYPMDTTQLKIETLAAEDLEAIAYFQSLERVDARGCWEYALLETLGIRFPGIRVEYEVQICGTAYPLDVQELTLVGADPEELNRALPYLTQVKSITLEAPLSPGGELCALREAFPQIQFYWQIHFKDMVLDVNTAELDLTGIPTTLEEIEELLAYLPGLTYLDMTDCGISNEDMDALRSRWPDTQIVWTVNLGSWYRLRTDATWFMPIKYGYMPSGDDLYNLRYCHDIIAIDIGHRSVDNIDFVAYMPHLKYLLLGDTTVRDLTPLTGLEELVFLELFLTYPEDLTPLGTLTALEDLNLHYTRGDVEVIAKMTWLKNLWWAGCDRYQQELLRTSIPGCHFNFWSFSSTGEGWRQLPNYYAQRDIFGMGYMTY